MSSISSKSSSGVGGGAAARVSIPSSVWKTIQQIKEITGNHSEEEIYAMLKECSMDPNETTQKLLFQDTFHEVKRKRERRKENINKESVESKWKPGAMGRGNKADRGSYSSRYASQDGGGGRSSASGKENGNSHALEKSLTPTYVPTSQEDKSITKGSTVTSPNEPSVGAFAPAASAVTGKLEGLPQHGAPVDANKNSKVGKGTMDNHGLPMPASSDSSLSFASVPSSGTDLSASDPVLLSSQDSQPLGTLGGIRSEVQSQRSPIAANSNDSKTTSETSEVRPNVQGKKPNKFQGSGKNQPVVSSQTDSSHSGSFGRPSSNYNNRSQVIGPQKAGPAKEWKPKAINSNPSLGSVTDSSSEAPTVSIEPNILLQSRQDVLEPKEGTAELQKKLEETHISEVQHVIIPDHLHVPEAEKLGFCFGSFDYGLSTISNTVAGSDKSPPRSETSETSEVIEETAREQLPSNESALPSVDDTDYSDHPLSSSPGEENLSSKVGELSSAVPEYNETKQENMQGDHQYSVVQTPPNYSYGFVPPILGSQVGPFESSESQTRDMSRIPNFVIQQPFDPTSYYAQFYRSGVDGDGRISPFHSTGVQAKFNGNVAVVSPQTPQSIQEGANPLVLSTTAATPLVTQAAGLVQSSIAVPQPPLPVFRQSTGVHLPHYPPNYIPYGHHYFSPFYAPPAIHQFFSNGAFPQQPQAGNVYQPPPAATTKYSLSQYKQGANAPNSTYIGVPGSYGPYGSATANYNPTSTATSGNPASNEDLSASQYKENNIYVGGQQSEGSGVWISAPGRDISSLHASSFYNLPQGGQVAFSPTQPGHGTFAGIYHPTPPVTNPSVHPLLQQSQNIAVPNEMVGPTANVYQQPQHSQINWPSSY